MYEQAGFGLFGYYAHNLGPTRARPTGRRSRCRLRGRRRPGTDLLVLRATSGAGWRQVTREPFTVRRDVSALSTTDTSLEWGAVMGSIAVRMATAAAGIVIGDFRMRPTPGSCW
jgi:hypothetical protein